MAKSNLPQLLTAQECAMLLLRLLELRESDGQATTRVRLSELSLQRLWDRTKLGEAFLNDVREWLYRSGWTLFFAGSTYAAVRTSIVLGWPRLSAKRLGDDLTNVQQRTFDFSKHSHLLSSSIQGPDDE